MITTHVVAQNVITVIRKGPSTLLMSLTCFKLRCGVCERSEIEEEEEGEEENVVVFFKIKKTHETKGSYLRGTKLL